MFTILPAPHLGYVRMKLNQTTCKRCVHMGFSRHGDHHTYHQPSKIARNTHHLISKNHKAINAGSCAGCDACGQAQGRPQVRQGCGCIWLPAWLQPEAWYLYAHSRRRRFCSESSCQIWLNCDARAAPLADSMLMAWPVAVFLEATLS